MMKRLKILLALLPLSAAGLHTGCEGTSSGVDNPELTVSFRGAGGEAERVSGELDVFAKDQNPALNPTPLATIRINKSALTKLTGDDFERINVATKRSASSARAASAAAAPASAGKVDFNLIFRSDARTGSLAFGMAFDPEAAAFARDGSPIERIVLQPKPLVRFQARLAPEASFGDLGRVYIPGTPFQATLSDSAFIFEALPEGVFNLQLLGGDGKIYAVRESLDTKAGTVFTTGKDPIGKIDTSDTSMPPPFSVITPDKMEAVANIVTVLEGKLVGLDSLDARASILWRQLRKAGSSTDTALLVTPNKLATQAKFRTAGTYSMELSVTAGAHTARDTLEVGVRAAQVSKLTIVRPQPGDSVIIGVPYKINWIAPMPGKVSILLSLDGMAFDTLAAAAPSEGDLPAYLWTPSDSLKPTRNAILRIRMGGPDSLTGVTEKPFFIMSK